jgi:hypothetical protein
LADDWFGEIDDTIELPVVRVDSDQEDNIPTNPMVTPEESKQEKEQQQEEEEEEEEKEEKYQPIFKSELTNVWNHNYSKDVISDESEDEYVAEPSLGYLGEYEEIGGTSENPWSAEDHWSEQPKEKVNR